jgi:tetratricopeptide (TPR) repeat protein
MQSYSVRDVERVLQLSRATILGLVRIGFVKPTRGARREYRFSFQDLIVLRTARALIEARVPRRRIHRSLRDLRRHLPESAPLSGLCIRAVGDRVVVRDGESHWDAGDGQYLLGFEVGLDPQGMLRISPESIVAQARPMQRGSKVAAAAGAAEAADVAAASAVDGSRHGSRPPEEAKAWFERGLELEVPDPSGALDAYQRALLREPGHAGAWINRGRLLHALGRTDEAEQVYRHGLERCDGDALLWFNLGVVLEDLGRAGAALEAYQSAIDADPSLADGHYNLARLYEQLGKPQHAIRHLGQYRRLTTGEGRL